VTGATAVTMMMLLAGCGPAAQTAASSTAQSSASSSAAGVKSAASSTSQPAVEATGAAYATVPYNLAGFLAPNQKGPQPGYGNNHDLDNQSAPKPGKYNAQVGNLDVPFMFPNVTGATPPKDVLNLPFGKSGTLTVAPGHYQAFFFLASVAGGPEPAQVVLTYQDGSKQTEYVAFDDWCSVEVGNHTPVLGTYAAWQGVARIGETDGSSNLVGGKGCGLYVSSVPVDNSRVLTSVTVGNTLKSVVGPVAYVLSNVQSGSRVNIVAATATATPAPALPSAPPLALPAQQPVTLAQTASSLCAKGPTSPALTAVPVGLLKVPLPLGQLQIASSGGDGPWLLGVHDTRSSLYGMGLYAPGVPTNTGYVYLSTDGGIPAGTKNAMLCVEYYDGSKTTSTKTGDWLAAQYSGTNAQGPGNGAYDYSTESYALTGTGKWLTASFTLTNINFANGDVGEGQENGGADLRVYYNSPTYFDRFWLVTTGVQPTQALAAPNTSALDGFVQKYQ